MRYELSDDQTMIRDSVRRFAESEVQGNAYDWDGACAAPSSTLAALAELGLMGMRVSEDAGGTGLDAIATLLAIETLAAADGGLAWTVALHNLLALPVLEAAGHGSLGGLIAGEGAAAWVDAPLAVEVDGASVRVAGTAGLVPWGSQAGVLVGCAEAAGGPVLFTVSPEAPGVQVVATDGAMGLRSSAPATVHFDRAQVERLDVGGCALRLESWLGLARATVAIGVGRGALRAATQYAQERQQFNRPIAQFQAIQWMLAETATELDAAQLLTWFAVANDEPAEDAVARAVLFALPAATRAGHRAVQIYGGNGYVREYPVERCLRDAKAIEVLRPVDEDQDRIVRGELSGRG